MPRDLPALEKECFFIAPIGAEGSPERNRSDGVLDFIIGRAADELGLTAVRADQLAEPGLITLQVIDHILGARAAVADVTGLNPNVFYELAVRHTARLPVALVADKACKLPFDIAQMRTIFFDYQDLRSADMCRKEIVAQLREALENGAVDSPIATSVDVKAMQAGNAVERTLAEVLTTIEDMARSQRVVLRTMDELGTRVAYLSETGLPFSMVEELLDRFIAVEQLMRRQESPDPELRHAVTRLEEVVDAMMRSRSRRRRSAFRGGSSSLPSRVPSAPDVPVAAPSTDQNRDTGA